MQRRRSHSFDVKALLTGVLLLLTVVIGISDSADASATSRESAAVKAMPPADEFAREVLNHEIEAQAQDHALWCFQELKLDAGKQKRFNVCQTKAGPIERLMAIDGQPLSADRAREEDRRIDSLVGDPAEMQALRAKDRDDAQQAWKLLRLFPEAFCFRYDGKSGAFIRLAFTPNSEFRPSGYSERVFHNMQGTILLDPVQKRLAAIDGTLTNEVKFGWGLLGYLEKGGTFAVTQQNVGSGYWEVTSMDIQMNGRALFFKTIGVQTCEKYLKFRRVPQGIIPSEAAALVKQGAITSSGN